MKMILQKGRRTELKTKLAAVVVALALALCSPATAFAAGAFDDGGSQSVVSSSTERNAGNMFAVMHPVSNTDIENDLYWAGQTLDANKTNVGTSGHGSVIAAGQTISFANGTVADSFRAAAHDISVNHVEIGNNVTVAAENVSLGNEVSANGVYVAAKNISIAGSYKGGILTGESVSFDGVVEGDLNIQAQNISVGKNAQVTGTLTVPTGVNVDVADGAQVPNVSYSAPIETAQPTLFDNLITILYACMAHIVLVGLFFLVIRKSLVRSANMAREQLVKMLLAGLVIFIVAPILCLLLIFPLITIPVVVLMVLVMIIIALFSLPFAGSALGLMLLGKRMNPVLAAVIGTVVLTIFAYIPVLSTLTVIFCIMFTAGYLWMCYWETHKERRQERFAARQAAFIAGQQAAGMNVPPAPVPPVQPPVPNAPTGDASAAPTDDTPAAPAPGAPNPPAPTGDPVQPPAPTNEPPAPTGEGESNNTDR